MKTDSIKLTKSDWVRVKEVMVFYNRSSGWINFVNKEIKFFDSKPSFGGVHVTLELVIQQAK